MKSPFRSLRHFLVSFVLVVVLPGLLLGSILAWWMVRHLSDGQEDEARRLAAAAAAGMENHLRTMTTSITVLSHLPLGEEHLASFYEVAKGFSEQVGYHVTLADANGNQFLSTRLPFGSQPPRRSAMDSVTKAIAKGAPNVSEIFPGKMAGRFVVTVDAPVRSQEGQRIITLSSDASAIASILLRTSMPDGWLQGMIDGRGVYIARSLDPEHWVGKQTTPEIIEAVGQAESGLLHNKSVEGFPIVTAFHRVAGTDWTVLIGIPEAVFYAPIAWPFGLLIGALSAVIALTALLAFFFTRQVNTATGRLIAVARDPLRNDQGASPEKSFAEFEEIAKVLRSVAGEQQKLAHALDLSATLIRSMDGTIRHWTTGCEKLLGWASTEALGRVSNVLLKTQFFEPLDQIEARLQQEGEWSGELCHTRKDGQRIRVSAHWKVHTMEAGAAPVVVETLHDISAETRLEQALRESEQRERARSEELSKLLDAVPAAVCFTRSSGATETSSNQLFHKWFQIEDGDGTARSDSDGSGFSRVALFKDGVPVPPSEMPLQVAAAGKDVRNCELDILYPSGGIRHLLGNAVALRDDSGLARGAICAFVDITVRREAELAIQAAKAEADRANNAKSRFLAAASHDLRQPLTALSLYADALKGHVASVREPMLANLKECIGSLNKLLTDLLDLCKLDAGVVTPKRSDFLVSDALASLISVRAAEAQLKGLRLRCVSSDVIAHTDRVLLQRIVGNLIDNAIRYTERGGVLIGCRRRSGKTWIEVWDTGIGIPEGKTEEIFEEFKQLDDGARTRGSGLGLAIVAKTATVLGLEIRVRSRPGRGSVFAVEVPLGQTRRLPISEPQVAAHRPLRIALVEDNASVRFALVAALQGSGHQVVDAAAGAELREKLGNLAPDIVVSDYRLAKGETGFEVITALRAAVGADVPAVLITGDTDPNLLRSFAGRGIAVLHKPLELSTLLACLEDLTGKAEPAL